jgi:hypothetical protein
MTIRIAVAGRNAALNAAFDRADAGPGPGTIKIYTGTQPSDPDAAETGDLLATFTLTDPAFAAASGGSKDLDADPDLTAIAGATGVAGWARCEDSTGANVFDGSVGTAGTDYIISTTNITTGQTIALTLGTITDPA